ncbi:hypothetical protein E2320_007749, partial [Naja naja]
RTILKFFCTKGRFCVLASIKLFLPKLLAQLLHRACSDPQLHAALCLKCTSVLGDKIDKRRSKNLYSFLKSLAKLNLNFFVQSLASLILQDKFSSSWIKAV